MTTISSSEAVRRWRRTLDSARRAPLTVTDPGRAAVLILEVGLARRALAALEDLDDLAVAQEAEAGVRAGEPTVALASIADELGIRLRSVE